MRKPVDKFYLLQRCLTRFLRLLPPEETAASGSGPYRKQTATTHFGGGHTACVKCACALGQHNRKAWLERGRCGCDQQRVSKDALTGDYLWCKQGFVPLFIDQWASRESYLATCTVRREGHVRSLLWRMELSVCRRSAVFYAVLALVLLPLHGVVQALTSSDGRKWGMSVSQWYILSL